MPAKTEIRKKKSNVTTAVLEQEVFAPRVSVSYACQNDHEFSLTFAEDAPAPGYWDCPRCGQVALRHDGTPAQGPQIKPARSHWDRLLQRRTIPELEALLAERLRELRHEM
ncbi:MAG: RNA polymerase-binding protein RbpA [Propionibacteriaceae bacterium]|nr:RNA polymerase-binding protein RbpA [Propionibacteriaceae bacterium]